MEDSSVPADLQEFIGINASETTSMTEAELDVARCTSKS
jgi:hypothetical protein